MTGSKFIEIKNIKYNGANKTKSVYGQVVFG